MNADQKIESAFIRENPRLVLYNHLARDVHEHLRARLDPQLFAALHSQRSRATGAANDQSDRRAFTAAGNTSDDCTNSRTNSGAFDSLVGPAAGLDSTFVVSPARAFTINSGDVSMQHSTTTIAQLDRVERQIHAGPTFDLA